MTYIVYKTTNLINNRWYIGVHKTNKDRTYLGSGDLILDAIKKHGAESFIRETLYTYATDTEAYAKEAELVTTDVVKDRMSYNVRLGGSGGWERHLNTDKIIVKDKSGKRLKVNRNDVRYLNGELIPWNRGIPQPKSANEKRSMAAKGKPKARYMCIKCNKSVAIQSKDRHNRRPDHQD